MFYSLFIIIELISLVLFMWKLLCELGSMCGVVDMFFWLLVMMILVLFVMMVLVVSIMVFRFELYILLMVRLGIMFGSFVLMIVWCVGFWFELVVSIWFMMILFIWFGVILVCVRVLWIMVVLSLGVVIFVSELLNLFMVVCIVDMIIILVICLFFIVEREGCWILLVVEVVMVMGIYVCDFMFFV